MAAVNIKAPEIPDDGKNKEVIEYLYELSKQLNYILQNIGEENLSDALRSKINK